MLPEEELAALEFLLGRARAAAGEVNVGDLVQLRPGADSHWQTSLLLVCKVRDDGRVSGVVLRPHRSGSREAWYTYSRPEVMRIGRAAFPLPEPAVNSAGYLAYCPRCLGRDCEPIAAIEIGPRLWWVVDMVGGAPEAKPKPIQRETRGRKDGGEIAAVQIGPRLWWVAENPAQEIVARKPAQAVKYADWLQKLVDRKSPKLKV